MQLHLRPVVGAAWRAAEFAFPEVTLLDPTGSKHHRRCTAIRDSLPGTRLRSSERWWGASPWRSRLPAGWVAEHKPARSGLDGRTCLPGPKSDRIQETDRSQNRCP